MQEGNIIPQRKNCDSCHEMNVDVDDKAKRNRWSCKFRGCRKNIGFSSGIWLEGSKMALEKVLVFIYAWSQVMSAPNNFNKELGMGHCSAVDNNFLYATGLRKKIERNTTIKSDCLTHTKL